MPQTPEQFKYMGDLYECELVARELEVSRLKAKINQQRQKIDRLGRLIASYDLKLKKGRSDA